MTVPSILSGTSAFPPTLYSPAASIAEFVDNTPEKEHGPPLATDVSSSATLELVQPPYRLF